MYGQWYDIINVYSGVFPGTWTILKILNCFFPFMFVTNRMILEKYMLKFYLPGILKKGKYTEINMCVLKKM